MVACFSSAYKLRGGMIGIAWLTELNNTLGGQRKCDWVLDVIYLIYRWASVFSVYTLNYMYNSLRDEHDIEMTPQNNPMLSSG